MEDNKTQNINLTSFAKASNNMIATNDQEYKGRYSSYHSRFMTNRTYTDEEIKRIIESGSLEEQQHLSRVFFNRNGYYKQIIIYYATLLKYAGLLIPNASSGKSLSTPHIQKKYLAAMDFVERMELPSVATNCAIRAFIDGCYFGVRANTDKNNFVLIDLPAKYCRSNYKDASGYDLIEFDLSYFNTISDVDSRKAALAAYPKCIAKAYKEYCNKGMDFKWYVIPSDISICLPIFNGSPLFLNIIPYTQQYDEAVAAERDKDAEEIRKIVIQKIPHLADGRLLFEPDEAESIHKGTVGMLKGNSNISVLTTYADVDVASSKTTSDNSDRVLEKLEQNIYAQAGVSGNVFAPTGNTQASLNKDLALAMYFGNKLSKYISGLINQLYSNSNVTFKYLILPITYQNQSDFISDTSKLASYGYSFIIPALALGLSQKDLGNIKDLENDVLKLSDKLKPLSSSYTQSASSNDEGGRPELPEEQKSEKTVENETSLEKTGGGS